MESDGIRFFIPPEEIEPEALQQIKNTASMPFVEGLAVMPDVHYGKGSTVGTVIVTKDAVIPAAVGVDIGCGMIAVRTAFTPGAITPHVRTLREGIERRIPVGIGPYGMNSRIFPRVEQRIAHLEKLSTTLFDDPNHMNQRGKDWRNQLGSLGGGNHFIELCTGQSMVRMGPVACSVPWCGGIGAVDVLDDDQSVWVTIHSGSRGVGNKTGMHWIGVAQKQAKKYQYNSWLPDQDLAYLVIHSDEYWQYLKEVGWCQTFAALNREIMLERVLDELGYVLLDGPAGLLEAADEKFVIEKINCHHNFVDTEDIGGFNRLVTRKGAIRVIKGTRALIPGSMGGHSYIVEGLGHEGSFNSAPHGAGRKMSRSKARKLFNIEELQERMQGLCIESRIRTEIIDEHPDSYKDLEVVMSHASKLVTPVAVLRQMINIKGD